MGWGSYTVLQGTWTQANGREDRLGRWGGGTVSYCQTSEGNFSFTLSLYNLLTFGVYNGDDSLPTICAWFIIGIKEVSECCFLSLYLHKGCKVEN